MTPAELLARARELVEQPDDASAGLWARAAAILARQALEGAMARVLAARVPGAQATNFTVQLLCLRRYLDDEQLAARVAYTWAALSSATHHHGYRLAPVASELRGWIEVAEALVAVAGSR